MKYIVVLGDGMADRPIPDLGHQTPLEAANVPHMDALAQKGVVGMVKTIPQGMPPGSDTANLAVMGYAPERYYSGRSPLEAASMGIELAADDVTFRCNLVTVSDEPDYADKTMIDYSSDEITTKEAVALIRSLQTTLPLGDMKLYPGISYRHCLVRPHAHIGTAMTPPHDITGKPVRGHLPEGRYGAELRALMAQSYECLSKHPINQARVAAGKRAANSCWFWGEGTKPALPSFESLYGLQGGVVCAVDLIKGIGRCAGLKVPTVPGATGGMVTDFHAKGEAALALLRGGCDMVYIHVEAPDECGHHANAEMKVRAIEQIDREVLQFVMEGLNQDGEAYRILLTPDHPTPVELRTHTSDPVPFVLYDSTRALGPSAPHYTEAEAQKTGLFFSEGPQLMHALIHGMTLGDVGNV